MIALTSRFLRQKLTDLSYWSICGQYPDNVGNGLGRGCMGVGGVRFPFVFPNGQYRV